MASRNLSGSEQGPEQWPVSVQKKTLLFHENLDDFFKTASSEIGGKHYRRPLRHIAGERIGGAEPQNLVPDYDLPRVNNESNSKQRPRNRRVPTPLLRENRRIRQLALALFNRQFADGKICGNFFAGVFGCKLCAIRINRSSCKRASEQTAQPT